jgi:hypothetical protein
MSSGSVVLGIDPGVSGALAFLDSDRELFAVYDMPTVKDNGHTIVDFLALVAIVEKHNPDRAMTEEPWGFRANATFAVSYGTLLGAFQYMRRPPLERVHPTVWQAKIFDLAGGWLDADDTKEASRQYAASMWGTEHLFRGKGRKPDDNRCDAACVAYYAALLA